MWVGGPSENKASAAALDAPGIRGPNGLSAEGYVLGIGRGSDDHARGRSICGAGRGEREGLLHRDPMAWSDDRT